MKKAVIIALLGGSILFANRVEGQGKVPAKPPAKEIRLNQSLLNKNLTISTAKRTTFDPKVHGFQFSNTFKTELIVQDIRFGGLCGGMVYTALDFFNARVERPQQNYRPQVKSPLFDRIYARQETSLTENLDKWTELIVNPFGWRNDEFFRWGLEGKAGGRLAELKAQIDAGKPAPLGLFRAGEGGFRPHHQVLAIGYDMGRYRGDLGEHQGDLKIFVYDPNFPNETKTLVPDLQNKAYYYAENPRDQKCRWMTWFVDSKYRPQAALRIAQPSFPADNLVHQLRCEFGTGGDDLRGGNDNVHVIVRFKDGSSERHENVNRLGRWINDYCESVVLDLKKPVRVESIRSLELVTTFGGGPGGDNWNLDRLQVEAVIGGAAPRCVYEREGAPLVRFDGNNRPFTAEFR